MKDCFENLLRENVVPIVNENDTISVPKLVFTDNDELAGLIASQLNADAVVFLSGVEGVLTKSEGTVVPEIGAENIAAFERLVSKETSIGGRGGMHTKFAVAKKLIAQGITVHIINGRRPNSLLDLIDGKALGTKFVPAKKLPAVKRRLAYAEGLATGAVYIDKGAEKILRSKKFVSLLPVGILRAEKEFKKGDII